MPRHARLHTKTHMHTSIAPAVDSRVCVCTSPCRLSATDRFIVAEQQRLVFLSLKESVFSPVEFNQFGGGGGGAGLGLGRISKPHLPFSHIHRVQFLGYTQSPQSYFFYLNRHNPPAEKQTLFYV